VKRDKAQPKGPESTIASGPSRREAEREELTKEVEFLRKVLAEERERSADYLNRLKYLQADLENLHKRTKKEIEETIEVASERLISKLLVIIDDIEVAMRTTSGVEDCQAVRSGFELILKKLKDVLEDEGLARIEAVGKHFDPTVHEAANQILREDTPDGIVIEEIRAGYTLRKKLLRPSLVIVAKNPEKISSEEADKRATKPAPQA